MSAVSYPPAPWFTHGHAFVAPYLVRVADLRLPEGLEVVNPGRFTVGLLSYVVYEAPSPLQYDELIWMPAFVRDRRCGPGAKGWYVSVMYVNDGTTLAAGREIWKLPKTLATFDRSADEVRVGLANDWASADAEGEGIVLSSPISIARHVIRAWLAEHDARAAS